MNKKTQRILKLHRQGLTVEQIAKKIGCPNDTARVIMAIQLKDK